jgi:uncharacterized protein YjbI with pentapeptide repeats
MLKDLLEELQSRKVATRPPRDWMQIFVTALPGLAAAIALILTWLSINATINASNHQLNATSHQLQITEQGQLTDRYTAAITNLGSPSVDVRLGGIYALQRIMQDSSRDQPTVVAVLCAFVRDHANAATATSAHPSVPPNESLVSGGPPTDIQAALTVVGARDTARDGSTTVVDFAHADLANADLSGARLSRADLSGANLSGAHLFRADLSDANLFGTDLSGADLLPVGSNGTIRISTSVTVDLSGAELSDARLSSADLSGADLSGANLSGATLADATLADANLSRVHLNHADLSGAFLDGANAAKADFSCAHLSGAYLNQMNLSGADLSGVHLASVDLSGANLADTRGLNSPGQCTGPS